MIVVRFRPYQGAKIERVEIDESRGPFEVLEACIKRIDAMAGKSPAPQAPCTAPERTGVTPHKGEATPAAELGRIESGPPGKSTESQQRLPAQPAAAGVRDASMIAYRSLEWSGRMTKQQKLVMDFFSINLSRDFTRQELVQATGLPINVICGRVNELLRPPFSLLHELGRRRCRITGESANAIRAMPLRIREAA